MKKFLTVLLMLTLVLSLVACGGAKDDPAKKSEGVMTYAEYDAAAMDAEVVIEAYVQLLRAGGMVRSLLICRIPMARTLYTTWHVPKRMLQS